MHAVVHPVRLERAADLRHDRLARRDLRERERLGRVHQSVEVLFQPEDAAAVESQPLPDGVAALDDGVERADAGLVASERAGRSR